MENDNSLRIILIGANGAMGRAISSLAQNKPSINIVAGVDKNSGESQFHYPIYASLSDVTEASEVVIDFSHPSLQGEIAKYCEAHSYGLVSGTTGVNEEDENALRELSQKIPVLRSKNFSYGISILKKLVEIASSLMADDFDIEIVESHHNKKVDAPSGTAELLVESVKKGSDKSFYIKNGRKGNDSKRRKEEITLHSLRGGSIVGTHEVIYAGDGEVMRLAHEALSKDVFALGALKAAAFISGKSSGYYGMDDIII
jgi:4-hydroxy-tetrahydrodipicolinate reductase